jgi:peptide/nickel transport system substrate-binding protein
MRIAAGLRHVTRRQMSKLMVSASLLVAFGTWGAVTQAVAGGPHDTLTIGMVQFPPDMHPDITNTVVKDFILSAARRPMTGFDRDGHVICVLCTEVPSLENKRATIVTRADGGKGMEVLYTLRPDLFWADGVAVTAKDVAFAFEVDRAFSPSNTIESVEAVDDRTVKVTLNKVRYDFDRSGYAPMSEHVEGPIFRAASDPLDYGHKSAFNTDPTNPGLWMGPYRISQFRPNDSVGLVPNPYWKGHKPAFARVVMKMIENTSALQANLLAGDVDMPAPGYMGMALDQAIALAKDHADRFDVTFQPEVASYEHLALQLDNPLLADPRVRHAMSMAIDRKTIVAKLFDNKVEPAHSFKYSAQPDQAVKQWSYNPQAARDLLAEAGFKPGPDGILVSPKGARMSLDIVTTAGNRTRELVEQVLQTEMKAIGIELVMNNQPARVMFGESLRKRTFTGLALYMAVPPLDWVPYYNFSSEGIPSEDNNWTGTNFTGLHDPAMDAALTEAREALDPVARHAAWSKILTLASEDMPEIDLYFATRATVTPKWLTGVVSSTRYGNPTGWIEDWQAKPSN